MTEDEYLSALRDGGAESADVPAALLLLADEAVGQEPVSPRLWVLRGVLIQLGDGDERWPLEDALRSYERALELAPDHAEVHEELGYWYDVVDVQLDRAAHHFEQALANGGGEASYFGMARVLAELGRPAEALRVLAPAHCPFHEEPEIQGLIGEIEEGEWAP